MLTEDKLRQVQQLVADFSASQLIWLSGYLSGIAEKDALPLLSQYQEDVLPQVVSELKLTIAYGTESGNSKKVATNFAKQAKGLGIQTKLINLAQYRLNDLLKEEYFISVISTQGEGEPPESAKKFYDYVEANTSILYNLKFGVLALGDTSYPLFCKAGEDIDLWLNRQGATRLVALQRCDLDYDEVAEAWFKNVLDLLNIAQPVKHSLLPEIKKTAGKIIYEGTLLTNNNLNDRGSSKRTHHIEILSENVNYQPGDSLGIVPENPEKTVNAILQLQLLNPGKIITRGDESQPLNVWLKKKLNIVYLSERIIKKYAVLTGQDIPDTRMGLLDLLKIYPVNDAVQFEGVIQLLDLITPRLYSISSSPVLHENEVHLTVALEKFTTNHELLHGLCSDHLINLEVGSILKFYIHKNRIFKLPADDIDIIMIGPGTGIAPFRSFLAEREARNATGKNWLFFGDQHFTTDFLYQTEIQDWHQTGLLTCVNLAFSRDQKEKIYVQHRMFDHGAELYEWIVRGAVIYLCGSKDPMGIDVEHTLMQISAIFGNQINPEAWLENLSESGKYLKDVY